MKSVNEAIQEYAKELRAAHKNLITSKHIEGFSGFRRHGINVIGARHFVGMTEFLLSIANELAGKGQKVMFVTTQRATNEILKILIANDSEKSRTFKKSVRYLYEQNKKPL